MAIHRINRHAIYRIAIHRINRHAIHRIVIHRINRHAVCRLGTDMLYTGQPQTIRQDSYVQDSCRRIMYRVAAFTIRSNLADDIKGVEDV